MGRSTRRQFTPQQKHEIVMQLVRGEKQLTALAREHGVDHTTIYRWREQIQVASLEALAGQRQARDRPVRRERREADDSRRMCGLHHERAVRPELLERGRAGLAT